jgi:hypothetical protein
MSQPVKPKANLADDTQAPAELPEVAAEQDRPNNRLIFLLVIATIVAVCAVTGAVYQVFGMTLREEIANKVLRAPNTELRKLRSREQNMLSHYQWIDEQKQIVRIPLSRAKELTLRDWKQRQDAQK